jgi:hypothetical protein
MSRSCYRWAHAIDALRSQRVKNREDGSGEDYALLAVPQTVLPVQTRDREIQKSETVPNDDLRAAHCWGDVDEAVVPAELVSGGAESDGCDGSGCDWTAQVRRRCCRPEGDCLGVVRCALFLLAVVVVVGRGTFHAKCPPPTPRSPDPGPYPLHTCANCPPCFANNLSSGGVVVRFSRTKDA